ncbi:MAG: hypothetical protein LBJ95_01310 [Oscillospiraceae bacterium]|jgi:hypothetical protein|nr:hypothetical protein [Oscillospiraceae bacterium]
MAKKMQSLDDKDLRGSSGGAVEYQGAIGTPEDMAQFKVTLDQLMQRQVQTASSGNGLAAAIGAAGKTAADIAAASKAQYTAAGYSVPDTDSGPLITDADLTAAISKLRPI